MKTETQLARRRRHFVLWLLAILGGVSIGAGLAYAVRPAPLLEARARPSEVEHKSTVQDQYLLAVSLGTEQGFRSVEDFFPRDESSENLHYVRLARKRLAELYLDKQRFDEAIREYLDLARDPATRVGGLIGLTNTYYRQENPEWRSTLVDLKQAVDLSNIENHFVALQYLDGEPRDLYVQLRNSAPPGRQGS